MHWTVVLTHVALVVVGAAGLSKLRRPRAAGVALCAAVGAPSLLRRSPWAVGAAVGSIELAVAVWAVSGGRGGWIALGSLYVLLAAAATRTTLLGAPDCGCHSRPAPPSWFQVALDAAFAAAPLAAVASNAAMSPVATARDAGSVVAGAAYLGGVALLAALVVAATGLLAEVRAGVSRVEETRGSFKLAAGSMGMHR